MNKWGLGIIVVTAKPRCPLEVTSRGHDFHLSGDKLRYFLRDMESVHYMVHFEFPKDA